MSRLLNDGSGRPPALRVYLNLDTLTGLLPDTVWPNLEGAARDARLTADGFEGVQLTTPTTSPAGTSLPYCGCDRINSPADADGVFASHVDRGDACVTLHVGWGTEDDDAVDRLVEAVLAGSEKRRLPAFIETHRATITQDVWRTVRLTERFPEIRFNCDFSHYYCGQELVYGDWAARLAFMTPIFDRTGFMHGRVASSGCMQMPVGNGAGRPSQASGVIDYLQHFRELWTAAMAGFKRNAAAGDVLVFAPELLAGTHYYARSFPDATGRPVEETDRYAEALTYARIARACWADA